MARTKQTARRNCGGKAPRMQLATVPAHRLVCIGMVRNHCGPFPLAKSINSNKDNIGITKEIIRYKYKDSYKELKRVGIWQVYFDEDEEPPYRWQVGSENQIKKDYFEFMDVAFYILDHKCLFLPDPIKILLKQCLEPLYIKPRFDDDHPYGRVAFTTFEIYERKQWKAFYKIYRSRFCDEDEGELLNGYEDIAKIALSDKQVGYQFNDELHANTESKVSRLSPDFIKSAEYYKFYDQRKLDDKERTERKRKEQLKEKKLAKGRRVGEKRGLDDIQGLDDDFECGHDIKRQKV